VLGPRIADRVLAEAHSREICATVVPMVSAAAVTLAADSTVDAGRITTWLIVQGVVLIAAVAGIAIRRRGALGR